jgi:hypothetical protein
LPWNSYSEYDDDMPSLMFAIDSDDNILGDIESVGTDHSIASDVYDYDIDMPELIDGVNILNNIPIVPAINTDLNNNEYDLSNNDEDDISHN